MTNKLPYLLLALLLALAFGAGYCNRKKEDPAKVRTPAETERKGVVNTDSIKSYYENQYREKLQAQIKADSARYTAWQANYKPKAQKAKEAILHYQKQPTLENCDSAVTKLVNQVSELETGLSISDSTVKHQGAVIASYAGTVVRKDSVISDLNAGWQKANEDNAVLTRKLKRRNKLLKIGGGIIAILAGVIAIK